MSTPTKPAMLSILQHRGPQTLRQWARWLEIDFGIIIGEQAVGARRRELDGIDTFHKWDDNLSRNVYYYAKRVNGY